MGRLSFVGLGLGPKGVSLEGIEEMRNADKVYLEYYTTPHEPRLLSRLQEYSGNQLTIVDREFVEDVGKILDEARKGKVVLAALGDPMIATTHGELRVRAIRSGVETRVVHSSSISSASASESGLHYYKFSRTVTVTREAVRKLSQPYHMVHENLLMGAHTLLLLEYDVQSGEGVSPADAISGLLNAETNFKRGALGERTFALALTRVGREDEQLAAGEFSELGRKKYGEPPHCLVIPGTLHFTETEAISAIFGIEMSRVHGNSEETPRTAQTLVPRYVEKTKRALASLKGRVGPEHAAVIENAELYLKDAESNIANGEDEMAMLNVGYAEGLIDSLGLSGAAKVEW